MVHVVRQAEVGVSGKVCRRGRVYPGEEAVHARRPSGPEFMNSDRRCASLRVRAGRQCFVRRPGGTQGLGVCRVLK